MTLSPKQISSFRKKILSFYVKNKRNFPWRNTTNPYKILVSEFMLQQTQTSRVIPKFTLFVKTFPTISQLAKADLPTVLKLWQGLGYNRRALFLHKTAQVITKEHNSLISHDVKTLCMLPGIGINTAGAVIAFSFNLPTIFIETNIRRVFIHEFFKYETEVSDKQIFNLLTQTLDLKNPRDFYYALMDYGVFLAKANVNANRKSKHYAKQSKFHGSKRQLRGLLLKTLLETKELSITKLCDAYEDSRTREVVDDLVREGFIKRRGEKLTIHS